MHTQKIRAAVIAALLAVPIGAIAANAEARTNNQPEHRVTALASEETVLYVNNRHSSDVQVYAVSGNGARTFIGNVNAQSTKEFSIASSLLEGDGSFRLKIYPLGPVFPLSYLRTVGNGIKTHPIAIAAGDRIELELKSSLDQSTVTVLQR